MSDLFPQARPDAPPKRNVRARERRITKPDDGDWFVTPAPVTEALLARESFPGALWEPACGDGAMANVLRAAGYGVKASDLFDRGHGETGVDFLQTRQLPPGVQSVVTNPPFNLAGAFADHAWTLGARKIALLGRLAFLEGEARGRTTFADGKLTRVWVFSARVSLWRGGVTVPESPKRGAMAFAWFVFERGQPGTTLGWIR